MGLGLTIEVFIFKKDTKIDKVCIDKAQLN